MGPPHATARGGPARYLRTGAAAANTHAWSTSERPTSSARPHTITNHNNQERKLRMANAKSSQSQNSGIASLPCKTITKITNYIRAGYSGLYLVSTEEQRVQAEIQAIAKQLKYNLFIWSAVEGLGDMLKGTANPCNDPLEALIAIGDLKEQTVILLQDFHLFLLDNNPVL